jgi:hypothetical protein
VVELNRRTVAGAALTGLPGWLFAPGISKQHIRKYEESIKPGKHLVIAHGTEEVADKARAILEGTRPVELTVHSQSA